MSGEQVASKNVSDRLVVFLEDHEFNVGSTTSDEDMFLISATKGECRVFVALLSPQGWHRHLIRRLTPSGSRLTFYYEGKSYEDQPVRLTRTHDYWSRLLHSLGGSPSPNPVLGIIGLPACELDAIPWKELADGLDGSRPVRVDLDVQRTSRQSTPSTERKTYGRAGGWY
jgi:hypothetical protein